MAIERYSPLRDTPFALELIYYQVGISMDGHSPWRARSKVFQYMENTGVFRHVVGHAAALTNIAVFPQEDRTISGL